ncbi:MAG: PQQ-binding-like beta-propeller repeat protein [Candidatus Eremiobacteraeota bacterium]|nr:PQQ-binding-like beta-propeller repeat protein [Candidatus Eremiobacteraeota bacterium]
MSGLQLLWTYKSGSTYDLASPIEVGGIVYAADAGGNVVALNATSGSIVWSRAFGAEMKMTPSLYDGHLVVATFINKAGTMSALYSLDPKTGGTQWTASLPGGMHGSPLAFNGQLYVPLSLGDPGFCNPGGVYMFDEATGSTGLHWLTEGSVSADGGAVWSPLTYDGSRILFGTGNTCVTAPSTSNAILAISPSTQFLWNYQTASPFTDDDVGGGVIESGGIAYVTGKTGYIYALHPSNGSLVWQRNLGVPDLYGSYAMPSIAAGTLITSAGYRYDPFTAMPEGTQYGILDGLDPATGEGRWQINAVSPFYQPPAIAANMAFTTIDGTVDALDPATGKILWTSPIEGDSRSQVIVANDEVVVADGTGRLYAYGLPTSANEVVRRRTAAAFTVARRPIRFVNHIPAFCRFRG